MNNSYHVSCMAIYSDTVGASSPEEAIEIVRNSCPYDIDGEIHVVNLDTDEEWNL